MRFSRMAVTVVIGITFIAACSNYSTSSYSGGGHGNSVTVSNNSFNPTPDTAAAGTVTFTWTNASNSHNVTWLTGPTMPDSSGTKTTGTYQATVQQGTYTYHCTIHSGMSGTIVVQ